MSDLTEFMDTAGSEATNLTHLCIKCGVLITSPHHFIGTRDQFPCKPDFNRPLCCDCFQHLLGVPGCNALHSSLCKFGRPDRPKGGKIEYPPHDWPGVE